MRGLSSHAGDRRLRRCPRTKAANWLAFAGIGDVFETQSEFPPRNIVLTGWCHQTTGLHAFQRRRNGGILGGFEQTGRLRQSIVFLGASKVLRERRCSREYGADACSFHRLDTGFTTMYCLAASCCKNFQSSGSPVVFEMSLSTPILPLTC